MNTLVKTETLPPPAPLTAELNLSVIAERILSGEVTNDKLSMIKELVAMDAERKFALAFVALQKEIPKIVATKAVPSNDGTIRYKFAPLEEIDTQLRPIALEHGFTWSFSEGPFEPGRMTKVCTVQHTSGHKRTNNYSCRIGQGPPRATESQSDGAAHSYAKRGALCDAFNIVVLHQDNDARAEGGTITQEQAEELQRRVMETESNEQAFLKYCGVLAPAKATLADYLKIHATKYPGADDMLRRKEKMGR